MLAAALQQAACELAGVPRIVVAYSGGLDSTVLLHLMASRADDALLTALHVNHQLHADADEWEQHCRLQCLALGVPLAVQSVAVHEHGDGPEAAARHARYAAFEAQLGDGEALLLAQHLDDQAETLLLRLLRGAGGEGLSGMPWRRSLGRGWLLRPLLEVPRSALLEYARAHRLQWIEDPSNRSVRFDRNYLRREVMPLLEARWPAYRQTFARAAGHLRQSARLGFVGAPPSRYSVVGDPGFAIDDLPGERVAAAQAVRAWLQDRGLPMPSSAQLGEFMHQLDTADGAQLRTAVWVLQRYREAVYCYLPYAFEPPSPMKFYLGQRRAIAHVGVVTLARADNTRPEVSDASAAYTLCFRRGGERLRMVDGSHLALKTLFQSVALPPWWRARMPLLFCGELLLVAGPFRRAALAQSDGLTLCWEPELPASRGTDIHSAR